jgi:hypothetical protein
MYKLTTQEVKTGPLQWCVGEWHSATGGGICTPGMLHYYPTVLAALFMNPIHANIQLPRLWKCEVAGVMEEDCGMKCAAKQMRITEELLIPTIEQEDRIRLALLASLEICSNPQWRAYAENWIHGPAIKFDTSRPAPESQEEIACRSYAYKAAMYENVEFSSAMATQIACQYKKMDATSLFVGAYGTTPTDTPARGRSREGQAMRDQQ